MAALGKASEADSALIESYTELQLVRTVPVST